jgi:hypothetical protein
MKNPIFWDVTPCEFNMNRRFGETFLLHLPEDGSGVFLRNVSSCKTHTASNLKGQLLVMRCAHSHRAANSTNVGNTLRVTE